MVDAPRVPPAFARPIAAPATADQSTPECCRKRWSSDAIAAARSAGEICASGTHAPRRACRSVRTVCTGRPWRSSSTVSELR